MQHFGTREVQSVKRHSSKDTPITRHRQCQQNKQQIISNETNHKQNRVLFLILDQYSNKIKHHTHTHTHYYYHPVDCAIRVRFCGF